MRILAIFLLLLFWVNEASASLYCVVDFSGRRCRYPDLASCREAAGSQGECELNQGKMIAPVGGAPFCLVEKWKTECLYRDLSSCERQATPRRATCIANPNQGGQGSRPSHPSMPEAGWGGGQTSQPQWGQDPQQPWGSEPKGGRYLPSPGYNPRPGSR